MRQTRSSKAQEREDIYETISEYKRFQAFRVYARKTASVVFRFGDSPRATTFTAGV
jgi:hypothetical protein